jgi:hypothetical protein
MWERNSPGGKEVLLNTDDLETILGLGVNKVLAANFEWGQSGRGAGERTHGCEETGVRLKGQFVGYNDRDATTHTIIVKSKYRKSTLYREKKDIIRRYKMR